jgi:hypothetical protein
MDRIATLELPSQHYERLMVLTQAIALQRGRDDPLRHDLIIAGENTPDFARALRASIPGYSSYWEHMRSSDHTLPQDLDGRIGYLRGLLDGRIAFWK